MHAMMVLLVVIFTGQGNFSTTASGPADLEQCTAAGEAGVASVIGTTIPVGEDGEKALVLDAQFKCMIFTQQDHA